MLSFLFFCLKQKKIKFLNCIFPKKYTFLLMFIRSRSRPYFFQCSSGSSQKRAAPTTSSFPALFGGLYFLLLICIRLEKSNVFLSLVNFFSRSNFFRCKEDITDLDQFLKSRRGGAFKSKSMDQQKEDAVKLEKREENSLPNGENPLELKKKMFMARRRRKSISPALRIQDMMEKEEK